MSRILPLAIILACLFATQRLQAQCSVTISTNTNTTQINCTNPSITLTANVEGGEPDSYLWSTGATGKSIVVSNPDTYEVTITINNLCNTKSKIAITKDVSIPSVSILAFPEKICAGETATLVALGANTYVWQPPINPATEVVTVSPSTTTTYTVTGTALNGCTSSKSYELVVNPLPAASITGTTSVCQNAVQPFITFTGQNGKGPYTFSYKVNNGATQTIQTSGQSATVGVNAPTGELGPLIYKLVSVSDANGCFQSQNGLATVTVLPGPVLKSDKTASVCTNEQFTYTAISSENKTDFSWIRPVVNDISNAAGSGNTKEISEILVNTTDQPIVVEYIFSLSTGTGCITTDILKVTVNPTPEVNPVNNKTYCNGEPVDAGIPFTSNSPGAGFSWTNSNTAIGLPANGSGRIPPFTATNLTNASITATISVSIKASPDSCAGLKMMNFTITVLPSPSLAGAKTAGICSQIEFNYTAASSLTGTTTFSWKRPVISEISNAEGSGNSAVIKEILHNNTKQPVVVDYIYTLSTAGCTKTDILKVTVNPTPEIETLVSKSYCNGALTDIILFNSQSPGAIFTWKNSDPRIGLPAAGNGSILPFNATNPLPDPIPGVITVSVSANNCAGQDKPFTITVLPAPVLSSTRDTGICENTAFSYTATSLTGGTTFSWTRAAVAGINNNLPDSGNSAVINENLENNTDLPVTVEYLFTLTTPGVSCITTEIVRVRVNPSPVIDPLTSITYCNGKLTNGILFSSKSPDAVFTWTNNNTAIGLPAAGTGNILPFNPTNTAPDPISGTINVSVSANNCAGHNKSFTITVLSGLSLVSAKDASICDGTLFAYRPLSSANNIGIEWRRIGHSSITPTPNPNFQALGPFDNISEVLNNSSTDTVIVKYLFKLSTGNNSCESYDSLQLTVYPTPKINPIVDLRYCNRDITDIIEFKSPTQNAVFNWKNDNRNIGLADSGKGNIATFIAINDQTIIQSSNVSLSISVNNGNCGGQNEHFKISVFPTPKLSSPLKTSVCDNKVFNYEAKSFTPNTSYNWTREADAGISNPIGSGTSGIISESLDNITGQPVDIRYNFILRVGNRCPSNEPVIVTVNPTPVINPISDKNYCENFLVNAGIPFTSSSPNSVFRWENSNRDIGLPLTGTGNIPAFTTKNVSDSKIEATIMVYVKASGDSCEGSPLSFKIYVYPEVPSPNFTSRSEVINQATLKVCKGSENINFNINRPVPGISYRWEVAGGINNIILGAQIKDTNSPNTVISFSQADTGIIRIIATDTATKCSRSLGQTVEIRDTIGINEQSIFLKQPGNLLIYPDNTLYKYQWGFDSLITPAPDSSYGPPNFLPTQVYPFFTPDKKFISANTLDTINYLYWVLLNGGGCQSRVYFNGPYKTKQSQVVSVNQPVELLVFPNPSQGSFDVSLKGNIYGSIEAKIYNALGQQVFSRKFVKMAPEMVERFNAGKLGNGIYFLEVNSSDLKKVVTRFLIQH